MSDDLYNSLYGPYRGAGPEFFEAADCPWIDEIARNWQTIRAEFLEYYRLRQGEMALSFAPDREIRGLRAINFLSYGHWYPHRIAHFPKTIALLRKIPHLTSAFINLLEPQSSTPIHCGETNAIYRCHVGLIVPAGVEGCALVVNGQRRGWREGEGFAFEDAYEHFAWNGSDADRVVLIFDVLKPAYRTRVLEVCSDVLGAMTLRMLETKFHPLRRLGTWGRRGLHRLLARLVAVVLFLRDGVRQQTIDRRTTS